MRSAYLIATLGLFALGCGDDGGSGSVDAPVVPMTLTVTGTTSEIGLSGRTPIGGVTIEAYEEGGSTAVATTTSGSDGMYTLTIETDGTPLDGYLLGKMSGKKDNYLYPAGPLVASISNATILMLTQGTVDIAENLGGIDHVDGTGFLGVQVYDTNNTAVAGVTVSSSPAGDVRYNGTEGRPIPNGTATVADGVAYIFNAPAGRLTVSATGGGLTFRSHGLTVRADQVTTTLVQP